MKAYTWDDMRKALAVGWGYVGERVASAWLEYNRRYFAGELEPLPIFLTPATPYGRMVGWCSCAGGERAIALAAPRRGTKLVADRGTLLHEMVHQLLFERGECTRHAGEPWCRELMRLHKQITGEEVWAGKYTVRKVRTAGGGRGSVRGNLPHPDTGAPSLIQAQIARWPHSVGIRLGAL
jgi:hypothetical protein